MESEPTEDAGSQMPAPRKRLGGWPAAVAIVVIGALVIVTGAVLLWLVVTTLGAFMRTIL